MDVSKDKLTIIEWVVTQQSAANIEKVRTFIDSLVASRQGTSKIVGQTTKGDWATKRQLVERMIVSLQEIEKNQISSLDEIENE